jgi:hypothetical protein
MIVEIVDFISEERLKTYVNHTDRQERAIALHNHTLQLGSSLMSMIALFELALRNSANLRIAEALGDQDWLLSQGAGLPLLKTEKNAIKTAIKHARKAAYSKLSYKEKSYLDAFAYPGGIPAGTSHETKTAARQALFVVSNGQVISQTTLYFWKRLFSADYEEAIWKKSLKKVFPNKNLKRSNVSTALEKVYAIRNRVAHHEPVYGDRLHDVIESLEFLRDSLGARSGEQNTKFQAFSRLQHLRLRMDYENFLEAWKTLT